jgi:hypothetical protein
MKCPRCDGDVTALRREPPASVMPREFGGPEMTWLGLSYPAWLPCEGDPVDTNSGQVHTVPLALRKALGRNMTAAPVRCLPTWRQSA